MKLTTRQLKGRKDKKEIPNIRALWTGICILTSLFFADSFAQQPQTPQPETFKPLNSGYYTNSNLTDYSNLPVYHHSTPFGGNHANDIINQQNQKTSQMMGAPIYKPGMTPQERQQANILYIQQQMANDPMYQHPNKANKFSQTALQKNKELLDILNEVHTEEVPRRTDFSYYKSVEFVAKTKPYTDALQHLKEQLSGKIKLSVSDAYFAVENAYGNTYLSKKEYDQILNQSADFIKKWLTQNGYNPKDNSALHLGIQKFLSDTLTIKTPDNIEKVGVSNTVTHFPFFYDYEDFTAEKDYRNYFLTKCLATGSGQCSSLPATYNALAQKLGAKSYLSFAPLHSFVKYPDKNGKIHNYEPTSNWKISDKWYQDNMFISPKAKQNNIYLDTMNYRQIVAQSILDLAAGYMKKYGIADAQFVNECLEAATPHFPKDNNIYIYLIRSHKLAYMLERELHKNNVKDLKDVEKYPDAAMLYKAFLQNEAIIAELGYQKQPPQLYNQVMEQHEFKGRKQAEKNIDGKQKRNLFIQSF